MPNKPDTRVYERRDARLLREEAERTRRQIRGRDDGRLTTMHSYFDAVTAKD